MLAASAAILLATFMATTVATPQAHADEYAIEDGIEQAVEHACDLTVAQGDDLLDAQAAMVGDDLAALTTQNDAENAARAAAQRAATTTQSTQTQRTQVTATGPSTINVDGVSMHFVDSYQSSSAPSTGAGLWMGSDSTTDGSWGYFIGHNPGSFWHVMDLTSGDAVTITDRTGASRTYHVVDAFTVADSTYWEEIQDRVTGYGESVILQTCCGDHANYRVVVAV
jgi:Sortase family.